MRFLIVTLLPLLAGFEENPAPNTDPRSTIVVRRDCATDLGHVELTLFANGTVRMREGERRHEKMRLAELSREELTAFRSRFEEIDLSETESMRAEVQGAWIEDCELELHLEDAGSHSFRYGRFDSLQLALSRVLAVVNDLAEVAQTRSSSRGLPRGYRARPGDILAAADGGRWQVISITSDGRGVELLGLDKPLTIYMAIDALTGEFTAILERRRFP